MAKQYGLNEAVDFAAANLVSFGGSFTRLNGQPIDKSQLWYPIWEEVEQEGGAKVKVYKTGLARAQAYAATNAAYVGQELAVIDVKYNAYAADGVTPTENATVTGTAVTFYGIQDAAGTLKELGAKPLGDDVAISVGADNKITLVDFASAAEGTVARKSSGKLTWVPISSIVKGNVVSDVSDTISVTSTTIDDASVRYNLEVKVSETEDNQLTVVGDGLYVAPATHPEYTVAKETTPTTGSQATYVLKKDGVATGDKIEIPVAPEQTDYTVTVSTDMKDNHALKHYVFSQCGKEIVHIDVPKDLVVESGKVEVKAEAGAWGEAGTYIVLKIANQEEPIYVNAKDLVDVNTGVDTSTVDMTITGTEIKADVKISAEAGNPLVAKTDGLYVNTPTVTDEAVENQVVVAVKQTNGAIEVEREQLSYKALKDKPTWEVVDVQPQDPPSGEGEPVTESFQALADIVVTHGENGFEATYKTYEAVGKAHFDGVTGELEGRVENLETAVFGNVEEGVSGLISDLADLSNNFGTFRDNITDVTETEQGVRLIKQSEINKLNKLNLDGDDITISGSVNASQVKGLYDSIVSAVLGSSPDLDPETEGEQKGFNIQAGAQVNLIESISLPDRVLAIENKNIAIPYATTTLAGIVKSSTAVNTVKFEDGVGTVNGISTDILEQGTKTLVFNCGSIDE